MESQSLLNIFLKNAVVTVDGLDEKEIRNMFLGVLGLLLLLITIISPHSPIIWNAVLVMGIFSLITFFPAFRKWRGTEMNFNAPDSF
jgi:uncharacterized membrane protein